MIIKETPSDLFAIFKQNMSTVKEKTNKQTNKGKEFSALKSSLNYIKLSNSADKITNLRLLLTGTTPSPAPWRNLLSLNRNYHQHCVARQTCPTPRYLTDCLESLDWKWGPLFCSQGCLATLHGSHQQMDHLGKIKLVTTYANDAKNVSHSILSETLSCVLYFAYFV